MKVCEKLKKGKTTKNLVMVHDYPIPRNPKLKNGYTWQGICDIVENVHPLFTKENMYLSTAICAYIGLEDDVLQEQAKKTSDFTLSQIQKAVWD